MKMKKNFQNMMLAALVCCIATVAQAQGDYDKYEQDNATYGTTPFINLSDMPRLYDCMPAHPAFDSPEFSYDMLRYLWGKQQRMNQQRIDIAVADAEWDNLQKVYANWKDSLGLEITPEGTPKIWALLNKSLRTTDPTRRDIKAQYFRIRPFRYFGESTASGEDEELYNEGSYPSGHTLRGWTITLLLIQIAPDHAAALYHRGMDYGFSRVIVGAHWQTDVDASRMGASLLFSILQTNDEFQAMMKEAREEYAEKTASPTSARMQAADSAKATTRFYTLDGRPANETMRGVIIEEGRKVMVK